MKNIVAYLGSRVRFNRNELSGAFGDMGTALPLIVGMAVASGLDGGPVFIVFGAMQVMTALVYGIPMPVQPLKAVALLVITQKIGGPVIAGAGLAIGSIMLVLSLSGLLAKLARVIPKAVVRGIQLGLGLQLGMLAIGEYIPSGALPGFILAGAAFLFTLLLLGNRRIPPALPVIGMGLLYAFLVSPGTMHPGTGAAATIGRAAMPSIVDIGVGLVTLALPQIPLSLGNSILATNRLAGDLFPEKKVTVAKIGLTYSIMNIASALLGGIPVCHGAGGMAGHYTFGARTGGSVLINGALYIAAGLLLGGQAGLLLVYFPKPVLGVILLFEAMALVNLVKDMSSEGADFAIMIMVALCALGIPYGYLAGMIGGSAAHYLLRGRTMRAPNRGA